MPPITEFKLIWNIYTTPTSLCSVTPPLSSKRRGNVRAQNVFHIPNLNWSANIGAVSKVEFPLMKLTIYNQLSFDPSKPPPSGRLKVPFRGFRGKIPSGYLQIISLNSFQTCFDTAPYHPPKDDSGVR